jgi:hypothetical protein
MAHQKGTPEPARNPTDRLGWPQVRSGPLVVGGILTGIGALAAMAGMAVAGTHVVAATRAWIKELETPPGQLARLRWEQAKAAAAAAAATWRGHPNAKVRLACRASLEPEDRRAQARLADAGTDRARGGLDVVVDPGRTAGLEYERADVVAAKLPPAAHRKASRYTAPLGDAPRATGVATRRSAACSSAS